MYPASLVAEFLSTPWALMEERLMVVAAMLARGAATAHSDQPPRAERAAPRALTRPPRPGSGSIVVIPIYGVITQRGNLFDAIFGGGSVSTVGISRALREAVADETVKSIVLDIDSPGGSVYGVGELADAIFGARAKKPIVAIANSLAASAAYWIGAAAGELYVTPGGEVGSIGVWSAHEDYSKYLDDLGIKITLIAAGKYKTEGNPYGPLDNEARTFIQTRVNHYYGTVTTPIAKVSRLPLDQVPAHMT